MVGNTPQRPVTCSISLGYWADGVLSRLSQKSRRLNRRRGCMLMQIQLWSWSDGLKRKRKGLDDAP